MARVYPALWRPKTTTLGPRNSVPTRRYTSLRFLAMMAAVPTRPLPPALDGLCRKVCSLTSASLGGDGPTTPELSAAIDSAIAAGVIVVVAAGNSGPYEGTVGNPGNYTRCVTVGATDRSDAPASFTSRGPALDVAAPGVDIISTYPNNRVTTLSGTSMASPLVAGIAALSLSKSVYALASPQVRVSLSVWSSRQRATFTRLVLTMRRATDSCSQLLSLMRSMALPHRRLQFPLRLPTQAPRQSPRLPQLPHQSPVQIRCQTQSHTHFRQPLVLTLLRLSSLTGANLSISMAL